MKILITKNFTKFREIHTDTHNDSSYLNFGSDLCLIFQLPGTEFFMVEAITLIQFPDALLIMMHLFQGFFKEILGFLMNKVSFRVVVGAKE